MWAETNFLLSMSNFALYPLLGMQASRETQHTLWCCTTQLLLFQTMLWTDSLHVSLASTFSERHLEVGLPHIQQNIVLSMGNAPQKNRRLKPSPPYRIGSGTFKMVHTRPPLWTSQTFLGSQSQVGGGMAKCILCATTWREIRIT